METKYIGLFIDDNFTRCLNEMPWLYTDWHIKNCKAIRIDFYFYVDFMLRESAINPPFRNGFLYWVTVFVLAHVV